MYRMLVILLVVSSSSSWADRWSSFAKTFARGLVANNHVGRVAVMPKSGLPYIGSDEALRVFWAVPDDVAGGNVRHFVFRTPHGYGSVATSSHGDLYINFSVESGMRSTRRAGLRWTHPTIAKWERTHKATKEFLRREGLIDGTVLESRDQFIQDVLPASYVRSRGMGERMLRTVPGSHQEYSVLTDGIVIGRGPLRDIDVSVVRELIAIIARGQ